MPFEKKLPQLLQLKDELSQKVTDKYFTLFNSIDQGFCVVEVLFDNKGKAYDYLFLEANSAFEKQTGLINAVGKSMKEMVPAHEQYWFDIYAGIAKTGEPARFENEAKALGHYYEVYAFRVDRPEENHVAILFNDIAERKRQEEQQAFLLSFTDMLRKLTDPDQIQVNACKMLGIKLVASRVNYAEVHGDEYVVTNEFMVDGLPGMKGRYLINSFREEEIAVFRNGKTVVIKDILAEPRITKKEAQAYDAINVRSFISVPLVKGGDLVIVLSIIKSQPYQWTQNEVTFIQDVAERTWAAVERARSEQTLRETEEKYRAELEKEVALQTLEIKNQGNYIKRITETVPGMISVMELATGDVQFVNTVVFAAEHFDPEKMKTTPRTELRKMIHPDDYSKLDEYYETFKTTSDNETVTMIYRAISDIGEWHWYRVHGKVFQRDEGGNVTHIINIVQNITKEKEAEEKINQLNEILNKKNRELESANAEIRTFSSIAATDYKETLKQLYTNLEYIISHDAKNISDPGKANIRRAQAGIQKMKLLTDDIVGFSKIQVLDTNLTDTDLNEIIKNELTFLNEKIKSGHVSVQTGNLPVIKGYPLLLSLLFHHLIDNAIKFRNPDIKTFISIEYTESADSYYKISITDNGIGFDQSDTEKIFGMFSKLHDKHQYKGSGVGLAICKKIMDFHNGYIETESSPGKGSTFSCFFPKNI